MERRAVAYAFGSVLGGPGIGTIAGHAVQGLHRNGLLDRAYAWAAEDVAIPAERVGTVPFGRVADYALRHYRNDLTFDVLASRWVEQADLLHGWNNMCLRTLRRAAASGATTVVDRASAHPAVQRQIVEREFREHGLDERFIDDRTFRRATAELREADAVLVPSQFVYDSFLAEGFEESALRKVPLGVDVSAFEPDGSAKREDGEEFVALFVGHVSLRKGVQYLLPAWERADVEGTLRLAGEVTDSAAAVVEEYRDAPGIDFLGWVDDVAAEYRRADALVFPSIEDGFGLVVLEAMAAGTPVLTTSNVGASEVLTDGEDGLVVEPRDVGAVADALTELAGDPERRRRMGERAREAVQPYTWERYGDELAATYRGLL
jgi:glycosyltransferase involved in cell wall biosynthesis